MFAAKKSLRARRFSLFAFLGVGSLLLLLPAALGSGDASGSEQKEASVQDQEQAEEHDQEVVFRHPIDDEPVDIPLPEGEARTEEVQHFQRTGENLYNEQDGEALAEGRRLYLEWCAACHLPDATGRIGPNLVDDRYNYDRTETDIGKFEIIHEGGTGAMQAFGNRITQDQILKIIAFVNSLKD